MNLKKVYWKIVTLVVFSFLLINPEAVPLVLYIDAIGLELFLMLLEVQFIAIAGYYFHVWVKPVLAPVYHSISKLDPYFFIPTKNVIKKHPAMLCHAVPFLVPALVSVTMLSHS
ncbi:hypothetical protein [Parashewanella tropica]|uniref:hypothetical protein n=1 Tax=Parashewanella tropica TaxID=2547970 RepID=UPI00105A31E4|nr:hypothetical protein [Parashewanella tropica]